MMTDFVSAEWVSSRGDDLRVVDVRDAWEYDGLGHLPGAVNVPFDSFRADEHGAESDAGDGMLPDEGDWAELLSEAGITPESDIVAYDDHHGVFAARFLVTAELFGHDPDRLHLLDGDFSSGNSNGRRRARRRPSSQRLRGDATRLDATVGPDAVADAADDPDAVLVDTREDEEYDAGHIPGAVLLDWRTSSTTRLVDCNRGTNSTRFWTPRASPRTGGSSSTATPPGASATPTSCSRTSATTTWRSTRAASPSGRHRGGRWRRRGDVATAGAVDITSAAAVPCRSLVSATTFDQQRDNDRPGDKADDAKC